MCSVWFGVLDATRYPLELDHKNGDHNDNSEKNLQLICPNCHAQTDTYRVKKKGAKSAIDVHGGAPKDD